MSSVVEFPKEVRFRILVIMTICANHLVVKERNKIRNLEFRSFVRDPDTWGDEYSKLYHALLQAGR